MTIPESTSTPYSLGSRGLSKQRLDPNFANLPDELILAIMHFLGTLDRVATSQVSKNLYRVSQDISLKKELDVSIESVGSRVNFVKFGVSLEKHGSELKVLNLSRQASIPEDLLSKIARFCPDLERLQLVGCNLGGGERAELINLPEGLKSLNIADNYLNMGDSFQVMAKKVGSLLFLEELNISSNQIKQALNQRTLGQALKGLSNLRSLQLSNCALIKGEPARILANLPTKAPLADLNFSHNKIDKVGAAALADQLSSFKATLKCLNLKSNLITSVGAKALAALLGKVEGPISVNFSRNYIKQEAATELESLGLHHLDLSSNSF